MSEQNTNTWPFSEIPDADDLDISAIFGGNGTATNDNGKNPFEAFAPPFRRSSLTYSALT